MEESEAIQLVNTLIPFAFVVFVIAVGVLLLHQKFRQNLTRQLLEQEELKNQHQRELLRSAIEVQENERQRFARDLHDELGAILAVGRMRTEQLAGQAATADTSMAEDLQEIQHYFQNGLEATRRISHALLPPGLRELGLVKALQHPAATLRAAGIEVVLDSTAQALPWPIILALYRISYELLHNTLKHAQVSQVTLTLTTNDHQVNYHYEDNGIGLSEQPIQPGLGLKNIEARVNALQGTLAIGHHNQNGFSLTITLPNT